ncbi:MAG TPA: hypothetical protein PLN04_09025 [Moraxellaceae bacterium]|nr:hypothetical protein [Moraxellaceae bacterium]
MTNKDNTPKGAYLLLSKEEVQRRLNFYRRYKFHFQQFINGECSALETRMKRLSRIHPASKNVVESWIKELNIVRIARDTRRLEEIDGEYRSYINQTGMWIHEL